MYDFTFRLVLRPSAFVSVGAAVAGSLVDGKSSTPHHSPFFQIDENAMLNGLKLWMNIIEDFQ
jgi:metal-dependent amidase/aminoacylase/carboxypeptidase family protein